MNNKVLRYMEENQLVEHGDSIVIGVSGGADSVCLLYLLNHCKNEYGLQLYVVHVNHGLRGNEAYEDEAYTKRICSELGLHFHAVHADVAGIAKRKGLSTEEAGRIVRYEAFLKEAQDYGCKKIAIAHHMNDTAETVLFHLARGSGLRGLAGIPVRRILKDDIEVIRPLLCLKREEIESYLNENSISYQVDETNLENDYSRNKLRNQILPILKEEINQGVIEHIAKTASYLYEINEYMNHKIDNIYSMYVSENNQSKKFILKEEVQEEESILVKELIRRMFERLYDEGLKDIDSNHVEQVVRLIAMGVGKQIDLPYGLKVRRRYHDLIFSFSKDQNEEPINKPICREINIQQQKEYVLSEIGKTLRIDVIEYKKNMIIPKNAYTKWFDYDKIKNTIFIRTRQPGDYIQVRADGGRKKIKDYFIDQKIPKEERDFRLLLADGNHVMWVLEDRISEAYRVDAQTKKILVISLIGGNNDGYQR